MLKTNQILLFLFLFVHSSELSAQEDSIYLKPLENEKLQKFNFTKIYPAKDGKLYLGSTSGLVCFDGSDIKLYTHKAGDTNSLSQNHIIDIVEDKKGNLYFSTKSRGINYLDLKTGKVKQLPIFFDGSDVLEKMMSRELIESKLYIDDEENLWIGEYKALLYYNSKSKTYRQIGLDSNAFTADYISDIKQDVEDNNVLWLATHIGIMSINKKTLEISKSFRSHNSSDSIPEEGISITNLDVGQDGFIWFGTRSYGMGRYNINSGFYSLFRSSNSEPSTNKIGITSLFKKNDQEYYVTSGNGTVSVYNTLTNNYNLLPNQFLPREFRESKNIIVDSYGNVWCIINGRLFVAYSEKNIFKTIAIKDRIYKKDSVPNELENIIWDSVSKQYYAAFSNSDEGLFIFNDSLRLIKSIILIPTVIPERNGMWNVAIDSKGRIWGYGWIFLSVYDSNASITDFPNEFYANAANYNLSKEKMVNIYLKYPSLLNLYPSYQHGNRTLDILSANETIYTINRDGLFLIDVNSLSYKSVLFPLDDKQSTPLVMGLKLRIDKKGHFLYACNYSYSKNESAIIQYNILEGKFKKIIIPSSIKISYNYSEYPWYELDDSGNIWVGTLLNVFVYESKTLERIYSYEKKNRMGIKQLINIEGKGVMCLMNENGIELYDYVNDRSTHITVSNGLYANSFRKGGYANNMIFVSYPGYLQYAPIDSFLIKRENRLCYLSELFVSGKENQALPESDGSASSNLKYYQNDITFTVSTTEFHQPQGLQYRYMLVGADREWSYSNFENRSITYRNLSPGNYIYKAAIKNSDGTWSSNELKVIFIIQPAFWQTYWFKSFIVLSLIGIVFLIIRQRIRSIRRHEQVKIIHEKELLELEAKALRAQMNPHFIFNSMNSIKLLINKNENDKAAGYLTTFSKLIRTLFQNSDKREVSLFEELETCKLYAQLEKMRFGDKVQFVFDIDEKIDLKDIKVPALILQPFIENAIWHGLVPKEQGGTVIVSVKEQLGATQCIIDDDGVGRELSKKFKTDYEATHQSKGIGLTQSRLNLDKILNEREDSIRIIDKLNQSGQPEGTTVIITFNENRN